MFSIKASVAVVILGSIVYYCFFSVNYITIKTKFGEIKGFTSNSRDGRKFNSFLGIPYALPPVGQHRFQPPVAFGPWKGIKDGTIMPSICPQFDNLWKKIDGHEDCLFLNIFTPKMTFDEVEKSELHPVLVFIHGGHFMYGGSDIYGAKYFMDEDVVVVTLNYRLGALGFLNTGPEARGNMGLKDQTIALQWIQEGIKYFGGNPNLVTIMGESAGGASVNYHMLSPLSDGLYHRAISQSGTALCPWAFVTNTHKQAKRLAKRLGCSVETTELMMKCLKNMDARKIVETQSEMQDVFHEREAIYAPSVEFDDGGDMFLYENPRDSASTGQSARVPWMLGVLPEEGCLRSSLIANNEGYLKKLYQNWNKVAPQTFFYKEDNVISTQIKNYYFGEKKPNFTTEDYWAITKMYSDRYFFECTHDAARFHAQNSPTFLYEMNYDTGISVAHFMVASKAKFPVFLEILWEFAKIQLYQKMGWEVTNYGICHCDDLQFLFSTISLMEIRKDTLHYGFSKSIIKLWVSFANDGRPSKFQNVKWENVKPEAVELKYLLLGKQVKMIPESFISRVKFWKSLHL